QLVGNQQQQQHQPAQEQQTHLLQSSPSTTAAATLSPQPTGRAASHQRAHSQKKLKIRKTESVQETTFGATTTSAAATTTSKRASKKRSSMRKSRSLDAEAYTLACVQSPLWATLTNARTINEILQDEY
ncbi:uncharacterized protein LOC105664752, partial [Ceratitis capitata]|uniref:uncharacterized protein LOC105664752 n=1 Tax=Ceratitis capitata TaxID=7213 RepID=UPI000A112F06